MTERYILIEMKGCPACIQAKEYLKKHKKKFNVIGTEKGIKPYYKNRGEYKSLINFMWDKDGKNKEGYEYYPMIVKLVNGRKKRWNSGKFIGGYADL